MDAGGGNLLLAQEGSNEIRQPLGLYKHHGPLRSWNQNTNLMNPEPSTAPGEEQTSSKRTGGPQDVQQLLPLVKLGDLHKLLLHVAAGSAHNPHSEEQVVRLQKVCRQPVRPRTSIIQTVLTGEQTLWSVGEQTSGCPLDTWR